MKYFNTTDAVILKSKNYGEKDKIIIFYTLDFGKIKIKAKGARGIKSKLQASLQVFNLLKIFFVKGKIFPVIIECKIKEVLIDYRNNLKKIIYGLYILDIVNSFIEEGDKNKNIFNLLITTLKKINSEDNMQVICFTFIIKFLSLLGYEPTLNKCVCCKIDVTNLKDNKKLKFSFKEGGVLCENCFKKDENNIDISISSMKILYFLLKSKLFKNIDIKPSILKEIDNFLEIYIYYLIGKDIKTKRFQKLC